MTAADLRRAVREWIATGATVIIRPDGSVVITPAPRVEADPFELVDMRK